MEGDENMSIQERYDELDNIVRTLDILLDDVKDKDYYDAIMEVKLQAESDMQDLEDDLRREQDAEYEEQEKQYWNSQF